MRRMRRICRRFFSILWWMILGKSWMSPSPRKRSVRIMLIWWLQPLERPWLCWGSIKWGFSLLIPRNNPSRSRWVRSKMSNILHIRTFSSYWPSIRIRPSPRSTCTWNFHHRRTKTSGTVLYIAALWVARWKRRVNCSR